MFTLVRSACLFCYYSVIICRFEFWYFLYDFPQIYKVVISISKVLFEKHCIQYYWQLQILFSDRLDCTNWRICFRILHENNIAQKMWNTTIWVSWWVKPELHNGQNIANRLTSNQAQWSTIRWNANRSVLACWTLNSYLLTIWRLTIQLGWIIVAKTFPVNTHW